MNEHEQLIDLTIEFAVNVVNYYRWLVIDQKEYVISKQLIRCATNAGITLHKAYYEAERKSFYPNIEKALQSINKADCCLTLLERTGHINSQFYYIRKQCIILRNMLTSLLSYTSIQTV